MLSSASLAANKLSLRVLSYNIHKGFNLGRSKFVLSKIKNAIELVHADLVFLQEVVGENKNHQQEIKEWPESSQFEYLADQVWSHFAYGKNAIYDSGHHGNAFLSKYPIVRFENIDISLSRYESRGILHCEVSVPNTEIVIHCLVIHLGLFGRDREVQVEKICGQVYSQVPSGAPLIIAGDFNDWTGKATKVLMEVLDVEEVFRSKTGKHVRTFPSKLRVLTLDRIYCRGFEINYAEVLTGRPWNKLSDHAALYADLRLK